MRLIHYIAVLATAAAPALGETTADAPGFFNVEPRTVVSVATQAQLPTGPDACGCARELTACLFTATLDLNRCLSSRRGPVGEAICFIRYEVRVTLCLQEAGSCLARCVA